MLEGNNDRIILNCRYIVDQFRTWLADKSGKISIDNGWSSRAILVMFTQYRAEVIRRELSKNPNSYRFVRQTLGCIPLVEVDHHDDCPCKPRTGCTWVRTKFKLPNPIGDFISVQGTATKPNDFIKYDYINWDSMKYRLKSRVPADAKRPYYTTNNGYIYLHNDIHKSVLSVTGIWGDPVRVQEYPDCNGTVDICKPKLDFEMPLDPTTITTIFKLMVPDIIAYRSQGTFDIFNNDQPDQTVHPVPIK